MTPERAPAGSQQRRIDVHAAPPGRLAARSTSWWGMALSVVALASVLSTILFAALYLRGVNAPWPPDSRRPGLLLPAVVLGLAVVSTVAVGWAHLSVRSRSRVRLQVGSSIGAVLGLGILVVSGLDLSAVGFRWDAHAYGSVYWLGVGFHWVTTLAGVAMLLVAQVQVLRDELEPRGRAFASNTALFWYYVAAGWWAVYVTLLAVGR